MEQEDLVIQLSLADQATYLKLIAQLEALPSQIKAAASIPGPRVCRVCSVVFLSLDEDRIRICLNCRQRSDNPPREVSLKSMGLTSLDIPD